MPNWSSFSGPTINSTSARTNAIPNGQQSKDSTSPSGPLRQGGSVQQNEPEPKVGEERVIAGYKYVYVKDPTNPKNKTWVQMGPALTPKAEWDNAVPKPYVPYSLVKQAHDAQLLWSYSPNLSEDEKKKWREERDLKGAGIDEYPDNNPKTAVGAKKIPLELVPPSAVHALAEAFSDGAKKYGPYNWREKTISSSIYYGAALRHLQAWWDGEDCAEDSGLPHLYHALACIAMVIDGKSVGKLNDNRPPKGAAASIQKDWVERNK